MFTIVPPPDRSMALIWYFIPRNVPRTFVAIPRSNSPGSMSARGAGRGPGGAVVCGPGVACPGIMAGRGRGPRPVGRVVECGVEPAVDVQGGLDEVAHGGGI